MNEMLDSSKNNEHAEARTVEEPWDESRGPQLPPWEEAEIEEARRRGAFKAPPKMATVMERLW